MFENKFVTLDLEEHKQIKSNQPQIKDKGREDKHKEIYPGSHQPGATSSPQIHDPSFSIIAKSMLTREHLLLA
jgi:hypothetical protein